MDILLTHGYFLYEDPHERQVMKPYPPLGLLYIASYLEQQDFNVGVFDTTFRDLFAFETYLQEHRPPVVGLYTNMMTKRRVLQMIPLCKAVNATVILGGPDPAYYAAEYLQHGADIIVRGEGEMTLEELLPHLAKHGRQRLESIAGIVYLDDTGEIHETPPRAFIGDLSANPWPAREAIDLPEYLRIWKAHHGRSSVSVIQARGCPYTCTWCSHSVFGHTHRRRSPDDAAREVLWIKERYNPDLLWYADDVFGMNARWLNEYAARLKHYGIKIPFECISRADRLTEPVIQTLVEMGCYRLWNGSESGSQNILDAMQRKVTAADVQKKTHLLQQHGIETGMFIMLGYKGETMADLVETVEHLKRCNPDIFLTTVAYPIKGTPYYAEVEADILRAGDWAENGDRDLTVAGRYSKRFYSFATRWMVSEVALNRAQKKGGMSWRRKAKLWLNTRVGWYGMKLTQNGKEQATAKLKPISINANVSMPHS